MKERNLSYYAHAFERLSRDKKNGGAPHKPILLLSLIDVFENELLSDGKIPIIPEIIAFFKTNWSKLVISEHDLRFALPFYHMKTEPFWHLIPNPGCELWVQSKSSMRSLGNLQTAIKYAEIDKELVEILQNKEDRDVLRQIIFDKYFPNMVYSNNSSGGLEIIEDIKKQIVEDSKIEYLTKIKILKRELDRESFEEEVILRSGIFKREVPKNYAFTCCISGLKISTTFNNATLIEACHIEPFSIAYNDTLSNGITLTPTLHQAFDRGIITISDNFKVIVSKKYNETISPQGLNQYEGKQILLPKYEIHYPNLESLDFHRKNIFEK